MAFIRCSVLLGFAIFAACGGSSPAPGASCTGTGCVCEMSAACRCTEAGDCVQSCDGIMCTLVCEPNAKCEVKSESFPVSLACMMSSECKGNGGDMSDILCDGTTKCELKAGSDSTAICRNDADCKINLGPRSTVACEDTSSCNIKCDADCVITCAATASCNVSCGPGDAGTAGMMCPDGRYVCGASC
jgi:hypothetical protein